MAHQNSMREADRHALEYALVDGGGQRGIVVACAQVGGDGGRGERDGDHEEQQQQVEEQQRPVDLGEVLEQRVMVDPDDADGGEADRVGGEGGPVIAKLVSQRLVTGTRSGHRQVQGQQGDGHGEDAVAERLEPSAVHGTSWLSALPGRPDRDAVHGRRPVSVQRWKTSILAADQAPSQGMEPSLQPLHDIGGVGPDIVIGPQVEGEAHGLPVALARNSGLMWAANPTGLARPRQRSRRARLRVSAAGVSAAGGPAGPQSQRGADAACRAAVAALPGRAAWPARCATATRGTTTARRGSRRRRAAWPRRPRCRPGRPSGRAGPRRIRSPPGRDHRPEAAVGLRRAGPAERPGQPAGQAAGPGPAACRRTAGPAAGRRARASRRAAGSSGSARACRRPTRTAWASSPAAAPGRGSRRTSACRCRTACSASGRTGTARSARARLPSPCGPRAGPPRW